MKLFFTTDFTGINPVGVSAICWAETKEEAYEKFCGQLKAEGMWQMQLNTSGQPLFVADHVEEYPENAEPLILQDGNY